MSIELGTFDVIIDMDWLVKHDAVIVCGEKVARKYVEQGCHLFLTRVTKKKSKEKRMEDVPVIRDFPEVFSEAPKKLGTAEMKELRYTLSRTVGERIYSPEFITVGSSDVACEKEKIDLSGSVLIIESLTS
ncbi:hypothetical protein Tco_0816735 [Tanacetum coccineum]